MRQLSVGCASRLPNEQLYNGRILVGLEANRLGTRNGVGADTVTHFTLHASPSSLVRYLGHFFNQTLNLDFKVLLGSIEPIDIQKTWSV